MSLLQTTLNTRDLGGKKTKTGLITIPNRIYRSYYNNNIPPNQNDINFLLKNNINTIIDIRTNRYKNYSRKKY